jgi:dUTP pyrophosphatase
MPNELIIDIIDPRLAAIENALAYSTPGAAAIDLRACHFGNLQIPPGETRLVPAGFRMVLPEGHAALLLPRSGAGSKGLVLGNLVGLIDSDYRGGVGIVLWNRTEDEVMHIPALDRVAQMCIVPIARPQLVFRDISVDTARGAGGFGSTGKA